MSQSKIYRCYVEKRPGFDIAAITIQSELSDVLGLADVSVRLFNRYDIQGIPHAKWPDIVTTVLSEPMSDTCY